jgi:aminoglycoside phosphotransferase (APT) family kinase protein
MNAIHQKLSRLAVAFALPGTLDHIEVIGHGNINKTYDVTLRDGELTSRYIFQQVNTFVFRNPEQMMDNIVRVTAHVGQKIAAVGGSRDEVMHYLPRPDGTYLTYEGEECWRVCEFVPCSLAINGSDDPALLTAAGRAFGSFQNQLSDFDAASLYETIPGFHDTKRRFATLIAHINEDPCGRKASVQAEIDDILALQKDAEWLCELLAQGKLPLRVTHNDTKINNVLFDADTHKEKTVIDLDTVMPGLVAYDFGDAIRFAANFTAEDNPDLSHVGLDLNRFTAFARGFVPTLASKLTPIELDTLAHGAFAITMEQAVRFLDDYLVGDTYFKVLYPEHNLDRTRNQLALAKDMHAHLDQMRDIVLAIANGKEPV